MSELVVKNSTKSAAGSVSSRKQFVGMRFEDLKEQLVSLGYSYQEYKIQHLFSLGDHRITVYVDFNTGKVFDSEVFSMKPVFPGFR